VNCGYDLPTTTHAIAFKWQVPRYRVNTKKRYAYKTIQIHKDDNRQGKLNLSTKNFGFPECIMVSGEYIEIVEFKDATHVLIDILPGVHQKGHIIYPYSHCPVKAYTLPGKDSYGIYFDTSQTLSMLNTDIFSAIARHASGFSEFAYNSPTDIQNLIGWRTKETAPKYSLGKALSILTALPKPKISGEHHIHFTAKEMAEALLKRNDTAAVIRMAMLPQDSTTSFAAGFGAWYGSLTWERELVNRSGLFESASVREFAKLGKLISTRAKALQNLNERDLRKLFEIDVLVNRDVGSVDWEQEYVNRTQPRLAEIDRESVFKSAVKIFRLGAKEGVNSYHSMDWDKFWKARWQWSASGSIHSQYPEDLLGLPQERELRNKFIGLIINDTITFEQLANRNPEIKAWSSYKYEWAKMRAIYGTDLTSYLLTHFAFFNCESLLPKDFPVGDRANEAFVSGRVAGVLQDRTAYCLDFEDFNSQHSTDSMQAVLEAFLYVHGRNMSAEQRIAARWALQSVAETEVFDNIGSNRHYKTKGTLMSGWRLTTFVNSVLNKIYTDKLYPEETAERRSVHNGDDVLLGIRSLSSLQYAYREAEKHNIRLQKSKCVIGAIAEFLRIDRKSAGNGQYLTRNCSTLVHSRIESKKSYDVTDLVEATDNRISEFAARGGCLDLIEHLREVYYRRLSEVFECNPDTLYKIRVTHRVCGGVSNKRWATVNNFVVKDKGGKVASLPQHLPGVNDYAQLLWAALQIKTPLKSVIDGVRQATINAVKLERTRVRVEETKDLKRAQIYRGIYKSHSDVTENNLLGKAMLTGFAIDVLSRSSSLYTLGIMASRARDPMRYLKVVT
jgi:hypothetical protein